MRKSWALATTCGLALAAMPAAAYAQTTPPAQEGDAAIAGTDQTAETTDPVVSTEEDAETSGDIVITAQRRSERLVDVPIAVTAVTGDALMESGITSTATLGQVVPGLRLDLSGSFFQPTVRGVGSATAGVGLSSNVATYIDGVYRPSPFSTNFELADIDSIQVLKGPQGTLFGRNATGGAILVVTEDPSLSRSSARGTLSYGRYNEARATLAGSTPLSDKVALGFAGVYTQSDGFVRDINTGEDRGEFRRYSIRAKLLFQPSDALSFLLTGEHYNADDENVIAYNAFDSRTFARGVPGFAVPTRRGQVAYDIDPEYQVKRYAVSLRSILELGSVTATSITGYSDETVPNQLIDFDGTALPGLAVNVPFDEDTFSQEVTLVSNSEGRFTWVLGAYYFYDLGEQPRYLVSIGGAAPINFFRVGVRTRAYAGFADGTFAVTDKLFVTLGGRYSYEKQRGFFEAIPPSPEVSASETFSAFTPRAVVRYEFANNSNVYLSYNKGFKAGGFAPTTFDLTPFNEEKIDAFEAGLKVARGRFSVETSAFYYDYKDLQVANYTSGVGNILNASSSKIYGADLQITANLTDRFTLQGGFAYTNSEYTNFPDATFYPGTGTPTDPVTVGEIDVSGNSLIRTPEFTGTISASYDQPIGSGNLRLFANYYRTSSFSFDPARQFVQDGYGLLSGRITYTPPGDRFSISAFGNNLTDETYLTQVLPFSGAILQTYGTPRTYGVEVGFKF